jgi:Flp pilus assembly protein CpaB
MPAPRKPKKVFVQFAIALVVAAVLGVGAVGIGFTVIQGMAQKSQAIQAQVEAEKKRLEEEKKKLAEQAQEPEVITYKSVQALADLVPGQPITRDMVAVVESEEHPMGAVATTLSQVVGRMVKNPIYKGEAVDPNNLLDNSGYLSVEPGMRAITIQVEGVGSLNGALSPGVHVDVLTTVTHDEKTVTRTLLQNIQVVSAGDNSSGSAGPVVGPQHAAASSGGSSGSAVTLAVTPKQAETLTLANQIGKFHLTLRNFSDHTAAKVSGSDINELMTGISPATLRKTLPKKPPEPSEKGFHNVNYSPQANLPSPSMATAKNDYVMRFYKGGQDPAEIRFDQ